MKPLHDVAALSSALGLSVRTVRRYLAECQIRPEQVVGRSNLYPPAALDEIRAAVASAREARSDAVRAAIAERTAIVAGAKTRQRMPKEASVLTLQQLKAKARKGGSR